MKRDSKPAQAQRANEISAEAEPVPLLIAEIDAYCAKDGIKRSSFCKWAINNHLFAQRYIARLKKLAEDEAKIRAYIESHPPQGPRIARER